jgi:hypothetical protein
VGFKLKICELEIAFRNGNILMKNFSQEFRNTR